ncbi:MAG: hypothetical protein ACLRZ2_02000 [Veillonella sp.]
MRHAGGLTNLDESDEINACTIIVPVDVERQTEEWLLLFKNETHNHPTEIEPFGGAATCLGLYPRSIERSRLCIPSYAHHRLWRSTYSLEDTLEGKLPQRKSRKKQLVAIHLTATNRPCYR